MSTIEEKLKITYLGLAGLTTSIRQLLSVGAKEVTSQEILEAVGSIDIDTTELAKEETLGDVAEVLDYIQQGGVPEIESIAKEETLQQALADIQSIQSLIGYTIAEIDGV